MCLAYSLKLLLTNWKTLKVKTHILSNLPFVADIISKQHLLLLVHCLTMTIRLYGSLHTTTSAVCELVYLTELNV